ncbi:MAG: hypothetical protein V9E94_11705 [Microthrixaceae bacterium]
MTDPTTPVLRPRRSGLSRAAEVLLGAVFGASALFGTFAAPVEATPSQAQCGNTQANPTISVDRTTIGVTETAVVNVTGTSYLLPQHVCGTDVFGGIYLFFGWVAPGGQWGPSFRTSTGTQGLFGTTYSYPGEGGGGETRDDGTGTTRLVSFTAGGESGDQTQFHMDGTGNWRADLTVRGSTYSYVDLRTGGTNTVDCRVVQCGVFTIGGHGKSSRTNERFTPINFVDGSGKVVAPTNPSAGATSGGATTLTPGQSGSAGSGSSASGSGQAGSGGSGTGSAGQTEADASATTIVGETIGEVPTTMPVEEGDDAADEGAAGSLDSERAAATVQDFGSSTSGRSSSALAIGVLVAVAITIAAGIVILRRRGAKTEVAS